MKNKAKQKKEDLNFEKVWLLFQETDKKFQETDKKFQETDKKFQETDKKFQETDKKLRQLENLFLGQWGKLVESLIEGNLVKLFQERGIKVQGTTRRAERYYKNKPIEIDILAVNENVVVVIEVKTTLKVEDVNDFIEKLKVFKEAFSEYRNKIVYGAVAFIQVNEEADRYAYRKGLFVIKGTGESAKIVNDKKFNPKVW